MELYQFMYILVFLSVQLCFTNQILNSSSFIPVAQNNSTRTNEKCLESFLHHSRPRRVRLVCHSNATYCPLRIVNKNPAMAWTFFDRRVRDITAIDRRDICVMPADNVSHMLDFLSSRRACLNERVVFVFPDAKSSGIPALRKLFTAAWKAGTVDIVIVLWDSLCHLFTYNPISARSNSRCPDVTPVLVSSWTKDFAPINDSSVIISPKKIFQICIFGKSVCSLAGNWIGIGDVS